LHRIFGAKAGTFHHFVTWITLLFYGNNDSITLLAL
jgi:hypothetical protein